MTGLTPFCPRCGGKLVPMSDAYGEYGDCLNCGFHQDKVIGPPVELKVTGGLGIKRRSRRDPSRRGQKL